jgi:hypothetical protein
VITERVDIGRAGRTARCPAGGVCRCDPRDLDRGYARALTRGLRQGAVEKHEARAVDEPEEPEQEDRQDERELHHRLAVLAAREAAARSAADPCEAADHGVTLWLTVDEHDPLVTVSETV